MRRASEFLVFVALAAAAHLAFAAIRPAEDGAAAMGQEGEAAISLQASDASIAEMVERWEAPPEVAEPVAAPEAPQLAMQAPEMPKMPQASRPVAPSAPGLSVPQLDAAPDQAVTAPAAPPPKPEPDREPEEAAESPPEPAEEISQDAAEFADVRPRRRPERTDPPQKADQQREPPKQQASAASPSQQARGQGDGSNAGAARRDDASTLSANQQQSLAAQWGAQVRAEIERRKRYPGSAGGAAGTVRVRITVGRDGSLRGLSLAGPSGHRALDQAAVRAVRAAGRFPAAPQGLTKPSYTFTLAMRFSG